MVIVLIIVGLVVGASINYFSVYEARARSNAARQALETVRISLDSYFEKYGFLPCPSSATAPLDSPEFGKSMNCSSEDIPIGKCSRGMGYCVLEGREQEHQKSKSAVVKPLRVRVGGVPFREINLPFEAAYDPWRNRIVYAVTENLARTRGESAQNDGGIGIVDNNGHSLITPPQTASYALISHGQNGLGAISAEGKLSSECDPELGREHQNCKFTNKGRTNKSRKAVFLASAFTIGQNQNYFDDFIAYETKFLPAGSEALNCRSLPICSPENIETVPICQVSRNVGGLPLCVIRQDAKAGHLSDEYEHDFSTWRSACDIAHGFNLPSLAELRVLHENREQIGNFAANKFYLTRSYFNPGLIENDDRKVMVWASRLSSSGLSSNSERAIKISPVPNDRGETGYVRCIFR